VRESGNSLKKIGSVSFSTAGNRRGRANRRVEGNRGRAIGAATCEQSTGVNDAQTTMRVGENGERRVLMSTILPRIGNNEYFDGRRRSKSRPQWAYDLLTAEP